MRQWERERSRSAWDDWEKWTGEAKEIRCFDVRGLIGFSFVEMLENCWVFFPVLRFVYVFDMGLAHLWPGLAWSCLVWSDLVGRGWVID